MTESTGRIFNIERFTLHDGPGIRTTVFLKGCPLNCVWCCNPESQRPDRELVLFLNKCTGCGRCVHVCSRHAILQTKDSQPITVDFESCNGCGDCVPFCYPGALILMGQEITAQEVADIVLRDLPFYKRSGGGLTLSGGEPLTQSEFSADILRICQEHRIHTAIQTSGFASREDIDRVLPFLDQVIFDIKHIDSAIHQQLTGQPNELILTNLRYINSQGKPIVLQIPLIPGMNDSADNLRSVFSLAKELSAVKGVSILVYHGLGSSKYLRLGRKYLLANLKEPPAEYLTEKSLFCEQFGVPIIRFNG